MAFGSFRDSQGYFWTWTAPFEEDKPQWSFWSQITDGAIGPGEWAAPPAHRRGGGLLQVSIASRGVSIK